MQSRIRSLMTFANRNPLAVSIAVIVSMLAMLFLHSATAVDRVRPSTPTPSATLTATATQTARPTNTTEPTETLTPTAAPTVDPMLAFMPVREAYLIESGKCRTLSGGIQQSAPMRLQLMSRGRCEEVQKNLTMTLIEANGSELSATVLTQDGCGKVLVVTRMLEPSTGLSIRMCQSYPPLEGAEGTPLFDLIVDRSAWPDLR